MLSISKTLPLALLLSLPAIAMDDSSAVVPAPVPAPELTTTLVVRQQLAEATAQTEELQQQIDRLQEQKGEALARKGAKRTELTARHKSKIEQISGIQALLTKVTEDRKAEEAAKQRELDTLKQNGGIAKGALERQLKELTVQLDEQEKAAAKKHDSILSALVTREKKHAAELEAAKLVSEEIGKAFEEPRAGQKAEAKPQTSFWSFFGGN